MRGYPIILSLALAHPLVLAACSGTDTHDADAYPADAADPTDAGTTTAADAKESPTEADSAPPPPPPPPPDKNPRPAAADRILFDTRQTLQGADTLDEAKALFNEVHGGATIAFTKDVDGKGTRALRVDWPSWGGTCSDMSANFAKTLPAPFPKEIYLQYKTIIGRTSSGGGVGSIGSFQITNPSCGTGGNAGAKRMLLTRDVPDQGSKGRTDLLWPGPAPSHPRIALDTENWARGTSSFKPQDHVGEEMVWTLYFRAASASEAKDGVARVWVNGELLIEHTDAPLTQFGYRGFHFPATFNSPAMAQSEYFWDILAWEPKP